MIENERLRGAMFGGVGSLVAIALVELVDLAVVWMLVLVVLVVTVFAVADMLVRARRTGEPPSLSLFKPPRGEPPERR